MPAYHAKYLRSVWASLVFGLALFGSAVCASAATNHALIVGVSEYPNLDKKFWLNGPRNDADLVRNYLMSNQLIAFDAGNIITLADGLEGAGNPTLAAIREAFGQLQNTIQSGDFVYLHFSGHGSQAPALKPEEELDGLDELFLPADIGLWQDGVDAVENALVDDELGRLIDGLRAKGASVWAVFDSCHSGTVTRGIGKTTPGDEEVSRKLPTEALGIPDTAMANLEVTQTRGGNSPVESSALIDSSGDGDGIFVAFYAAQTNQTTPEMNLPPNDPDRKPHGLFTYTLFEALAQNPDLSYRQLGQEILRRYTVNYRVQPTPLFEGDLDAAVF
ncbi:MAG: peptidase C14, partial [Hyphomicrobiales bacterium]